MRGRPENRLTVAIGVVALVAGVVSLVTLSGTAEIVASSVLFGLSALAFVSLVFLLIGQSEEDDRRRHPRG